MPNLPAVLIGASALLVFVLGVMHLVLTYSSLAFHPRDAALADRMKAEPMRITRATTMWRAWVGFHASHSLGAMMFGAVYGYLALETSGFLFRSGFLLLLGIVILAAYLTLAKLYWFKTPFRGIALALALYLAGCTAWWTGGPARALLPT